MWHAIAIAIVTITVRCLAYWCVALHCLLSSVDSGRADCIYIWSILSSSRNTQHNTPCRKKQAKVVLDR